MTEEAKKETLFSPSPMEIATLPPLFFKVPSNKSRAQKAMSPFLISLGLFLNVAFLNGVESLPYYQNAYYKQHHPQQKQLSLPGTRFNMGIDPWSGGPEKGNIGFGNNLAAFFYVCHTCNRAGK